MQAYGADTHCEGKLKVWSSWLWRRDTHRQYHRLVPTGDLYVIEIVGVLIRLSMNISRGTEIHVTDL